MMFLEEGIGSRARGKGTYYTPNRVPVKRIPPDTHHHRPHTAPLPRLLLPFIPFTLTLSLIHPPPLLPLPLPTNIHPRPPKINPTLHVLVPAHAQSRQRYVCSRNPEVFAAAAEAFYDGAGERDWEWGGGAGGGAGGGGARLVGAHCVGWAWWLGCVSW